MGYSIMCPFENESIKNKMLSFLNKNYRKYESISKCGNEDNISNPKDELDYGPHDNTQVIGFDYGMLGFDREYAFILCCWMSVMAGDIKDVDVDGEIYHNHKYIIYDGDELIPLCVRDESTDSPATRDVIIVNKHGFNPIYKSKFIFLNSEIKKANAIIEKELIRLTDLYLNETSPSE